MNTQQKNLIISTIQKVNALRKRDRYIVEFDRSKDRQWTVRVYENEWRSKDDPKYNDPPEKSTSLMHTTFILALGNEIARTAWISGGLVSGSDAPGFAQPCIAIT